MDLIKHFLDVIDAVDKVGERGVDLLGAGGKLPGGRAQLAGVNLLLLVCEGCVGGRDTRAGLLQRRIDAFQLGGVEDQRVVDLGEALASETIDWLIGS